MYGFICIFSKKKQPVSIDIIWKNKFAFQDTPVIRKIEGSHYNIEQCTSEKFLQEKIWLNNDDFFCVSEGVISNFEELYKEFNTQNLSDLLRKMYEKKNFFSNFEGSFIGIFYDKVKNICFVFNNHTNTKRLFYFQNNDFFIFSTDLFTLSQALKKLGIHYSLNEQAAYLMLSKGFVFENLTLIDNVFKLRAGEFLKIENEKLTCDYYFHLQNINETTDNKNTIINTLDTLFKKAVIANFEINKKYDLKNITTLSGGLDSRMSALIAYKLGLKNQHLINFSEKGYADQLIARQIAAKYNLPISQYNLDPNLLTDIDNVIAVNDGDGTYTGCSHVFSILKNIPKNTGSIHTGIMGDTVMGSASNKDETKIKQRLFGSRFTFPIAKEYIENIIPQYKNVELCVIYNNIFTNESNGFLYFDIVGNTCSPFLNKDFLSYSYSIPEKYKLNRNLYIDWIRTLHKDISNFTWETIAGKPTNNKYLLTFYKYKRAIIKRLPIKTMWKNNMNPEQIWYDKNVNVKNKINEYFKENIDKIENKTLRDDTISQFTNGNIEEKANCITLIGAIKLLFYN